MLNWHDHLFVKFRFQSLNMETFLDFKLTVRGSTINNFEAKKLEKRTLKDGKQDHTFTKIYKLYNRITTKRFSSAAADSKCCGAVNAMVVKKVWDANVPLKLLPNTKNTSMLYQDLAARKTHFHSYYILNAF